VNCCSTTRSRLIYFGIVKLHVAQRNIYVAIYLVLLPGPHSVKFNGHIRYRYVQVVTALHVCSHDECIHLSTAVCRNRLGSDSRSSRASRFSLVGPFFRRRPCFCCPAVWRRSSSRSVAPSEAEEPPKTSTSLPVKRALWCHRDGRHHGERSRHEWFVGAGRSIKNLCTRTARSHAISWSCSVIYGMGNRQVL
jgi:hypothetical protein